MGKKLLIQFLHAIKYKNIILLVFFLTTGSKGTAKNIAKLSKNIIIALPKSGCVATSAKTIKININGFNAIL